MPGPVFIDPLLQALATIVYGITLSSPASITKAAAIVEGWPTLQFAPATVAIYYCGQDPDKPEEWFTLVDTAVIELVEVTWFWNLGTTQPARAQMQADARAALRATSKAMHENVELSGTVSMMLISEATVGPLRDPSGQILFAARLRMAITTLGAEAISDPG